MKVRILKGTNQIGGCITEITSDKGSKILIDYGCDLNKDKDILPEINWSEIDGVFITHNHDDHIGHINEIPKEVKVYVEEESLGIYNRLNDFMKTPKKLRDVNTFKINTKIDTDIEDMEIRNFVVDHSAFNSCMFLVECDGKRLLHMGDFRNNGKKGDLLEDKLKEIKNVDVLVMEGTTITRLNNKKNKTEEELQKEITEVMSKYNQVLIMQSSTNVDRTTTMYKAARDTGKIFIMDLCTANINKYLHELGHGVPDAISFKKVYSFLPFSRREDPPYSDFYKKYAEPLNKYDAHTKLNQDYALIIKQSMLKDIKKRYKDGNLNKACLIYSMWEGYEDDEKMKKFIAELKKMGVKKYNKHTSGHADEAARQLVINTLEYKYLIPIHTEDKSKYVKYPKSVILEDNEFLEVK